jgi:hypothetical protein
MKAAFIGNYVVPYTSETYYTRALEENGWQVDRVPQDEAFNMPQVEATRRFGDCDAVFYTRTHNATALGFQWSDVWQKLAAADIVTASMHLDRFWDLEREMLITGPEPDALFTTKFVFTADGGDHPWVKYGINHRWMPPAVDRYECVEMPGEHVEALAHDVVFVGSGSTYHGAYPQRQELLDHLRRTYGDRFVHYGHGGGKGVRRMKDLNDLYVSAKVVVGDSCFANGRPAGVRHDRYWSDRIPETWGRGGFLLHPYVAGVAAVYGVATPTYVPGDWDDLDAQIGTYLADEGARAGFVERTRARMLGEHTWTRRVGEVLRTMGFAREGES